MNLYHSSLQRLSVHSQNPNDFWMKLVKKSLKTVNAHRFDRNTHSPGFQGSFPVKLKSKQSREHWKVNLPSRFFSVLARSERYVCVWVLYDACMLKPLLDCTPT